VNISLSVAMMAHPKRTEQVQRILGQLDRDCPVVWDEKQSRWDTGKRAMLAYDPTCTHHAVIQDDVLVCRDLFAGVVEALAHVPEDVAVCGYVGRVRPSREMVANATMLARKHHASWITMRTLNWGLLIVVPTRCITEMIAYCDPLRDVPNYDRRLSRYWELGRGAKTWYTWPSLVDHADGPSLVPGRVAVSRVGGKTGRIAHNFIGEQASALDVDWNGAVVDAEQPMQDGKLVYRSRVTGEELRLKPWSPRVRRLRGVPGWELVSESTTQGDQP